MPEKMPPISPQLENDSPENMSRRDFLRNAGKVVGAAAILGSGLGRVPEALSDTTEDTGELEAMQDLLILKEKLRTDFGVEIDFSPIFPQESNKGLSGKSIENVLEKRDACEAVLDALSQYPSFLSRKAHVTVIRFLSDFSLVVNKRTGRKKEVGGVALSDEGIMFIHYPDEDELYDDTHDDGSRVQMARKEIIKGYVHHELEHMIETPESIDGWDSVRTAADTQVDSKDVPYYLYQYEYSPTEPASVTADTRGFAFAHGKTNALEDRATIAECLLSRYGKSTEFHEKVKKDIVLQSKARYMKQFYFKQSYGLMNDSYWNLLNNSKIDSQVIADFLKIQADILSSMSDAAFLRFMQETIGEQANEAVARKWKEELRSWTKERTN